MKKITINGEEYAVKYTIRALFIWEQITGKPFRVATLLDNYIFFYSIILASNQDKQALSWDDFINALDDDTNLFNEIAKAVEAQQKKDEIFSNKEEEGEKDEKKINRQ